MKRTITSAFALALILAPALSFAAGTPAKKPAALPTPIMPKTPLHTEFKVEVNKMGQVVLVKSGKSSKDDSFNAKTYGNVLQTWIRRPDGSAVVGMYRVTYDYDPRTHVIRRGVSLVSRGGNWGDKEGAANNMMDIAKREYLQGIKHQQQNDNAAKNLPDIQGIVKRDVKKAKPSPSPKP
jgi:hypothetical protein